MNVNYICDLMNPITIETARAIKRTTPTIAMNGLMGYRVVMSITPIAIMKMAATSPKTIPPRLSLICSFAPHNESIACLLLSI
jgi:hypothetical protein